MIPSAFKEWVKQYVEQYVANVLRLSHISRSTADGEGDGLEGHQTFPGEPTYDYPMLRSETWGLRSVPPVGVEGVAVHVHGGSQGGVIVGTHSTKYGPLDLKAGETALYSKVTGAVIKLDESGKITIDAPAGQDVVVNGGSAKVHRVGDHGEVGTLELTLSAGPQTLTWLYADPDGGITTGGSGQNITLVAKATEGAARFKG